MKNRLQEIDDIRGISMIVMILIHTNAYLLSDPIAALTREISQFAVVAFIFCSTYISVHRPYPTSISELFPYVMKRLKRLLIPYYIFLVGYMAFMNIFAKKIYSQKNIVENFFLTGGIDFNWLVLLFVQFIFITPLLQYLAEKKRPLFHLYSVAAFISSVYFLTHTPLVWYRLIMWLPWSLVIVFTLYFDQLWNDRKIFFLSTLVFGIAYYFTMKFVLIPAHHPLSMYANKYPPNIYHIAYSLFASNILYVLSSWKVFANRFVNGVISFFSQNSYTIYFIHILVIESVVQVIRLKNWVLFFLVVSYITVLLQFVYDTIQRKLLKLSSASQH